MAVGSDRSPPSLSMRRPLAQLRPKPKASKASYPAAPQINDSAVSGLANNQMAMSTAQGYMGSDRVGARGVSSGKAQNYYDDYAQQTANAQGQMQAAGTAQQAAMANQQANYQAEMLHKGEQLGYGGMLEGLRQANAARQLQGIQQGNAYKDMMGQHAFNMNQTTYTNPASMIAALFR
jgi:hypothetical protein